jgi:Flp pilus assembly pilin Flp
VADDAGQDLAEYAVMLVLVFVIVVGTVQLIARMQRLGSQLSPVRFGEASETSSLHA